MDNRPDAVIRTHCHLRIVTPMPFPVDTKKRSRRLRPFRLTVTQSNSRLTLAHRKPQLELRRGARLGRGVVGGSLQALLIRKRENLEARVELKLIAATNALPARNCRMSRYKKLFSGGNFFCVAVKRELIFSVYSKHNKCRKLASVLLIVSPKRRRASKPNKHTSRRVFIV